MKIEKRTSPVQGTITVPGDKSISHRSVMFGSIAKGETFIKGFLTGDDCISTINCFLAMGVDISLEGDSVRIKGNGLHGLKKPEKVLYTGNSGTTTRLISGILCGQSFDSILTGDESICKRPMTRIIKPLSLMGANITSNDGLGHTPLTIKGNKLTGINYKSPIASAQVKSSILLAGLYADGQTSVTEPVLSRNHTELMLKSFGADIVSSDKTATIKSANELYGISLEIPGDISSASYFMALGLLVKGSELTIKNVGLNETRDGIIRVIKSMNGNITLSNIHYSGGEKVGDITVKYSELKGTKIEGDIIPTLIDEIPIIAVLAANATGTTLIKDAQELKAKETDRIKAICESMTNIGVRVTPYDDGFEIEGTDMIKGGTIDSYGDHRIAMSMAICALISQNGIEINNPDCIQISFPNFFELLNSL